MSAIAGATNPTISKGITKPRKELNTLLKVAKLRHSQSGAIMPRPMPAAMAMTTFGKRPILFKEIKN